MHSSIYHPGRQANFVLRQATLFRNRWFVAAAAILGVLLILTLVNAYLHPEKLLDMRSTYQFVFILTGLIFTSQIFMELHSPNQAYAYLTLPVSTLEKLVGSWLLSAPLFILGYTAVTYLIYFLGIVVTGFAVSPLSFFSEGYWDTISTYLVIQTIFLWGAAYFRKSNFLKTILALFVLTVAVGAYAGALVYVIYGGSFNVESETVGIPPFIEDVFVPAMKVLFWGILGPYMLLVTYFTLKERQL